MKRLEAGLPVDLDVDDEAEDTTVEHLSQDEYIRKVLAGEIKPDVKTLTTPKTVAPTKLTDEERAKEEAQIRKMFDKKERAKAIYTKLKNG